MAYIEEQFLTVSKKITEYESEIGSLRFKYERLLLQSTIQYQDSLFRSIENIFIITIRQVFGTREADICVGIMTTIGYITSKLCCDAEELLLFDKEKVDIPMLNKSIWVDENICLINTTDHFGIDNQIINDKGIQLCSIMMYDNNSEELIEHQLEINNCLESICQMSIDSFSNQTLLNGTAIVCHLTGQYGIVTKSKFQT